MHEHFNAIDGEFQFAHHKDSYGLPKSLFGIPYTAVNVSSDPEEISAYLDHAVASSCEGLISCFCSKTPADGQNSRSG